MSDPGAERTFAFLIHPRSNRDFGTKYPILKLLPARLVGFFARFAPTLHVANLHGFVSTQGERVHGVLLAVPMAAPTMLRNRPLARKLVLRAVQKAHALGATHVGLGGYTSVVTDGGQWLEDQVADVSLTNGNALTAAMSYRGFSEIYQGSRRTTIAVIGATGSIGSAVAKEIAAGLPFKDLLVVGRTPSHIADLMSTLSRYPNAQTIRSTTVAEAVSAADYIVNATSSNDTIIAANALKQDAVVYDITQPSNIDPDVLATRKDVRVYDGGLVELPKGVRVGYNLGIPKGSLFSCTAETALISLENRTDHFCLGHVTATHIEHISALADQYALKPATVLVSST